MGGQLSNRPQGSSCVCLLSVRIISIHTQIDFFYMVLGIELEFSGLLDKYFSS